MKKQIPTWLGIFSISTLALALNVANAQFRD